MRIIVLVLLILAAHFSLTVFAPSPAGKAAFYWPWAADSHSFVPDIGGMPQQGASVVTPALAGIGGLCLLMAALALLGIVVPAAWGVPLIIVGAMASIALFVLYLSPLALLPIALNLILLWGVFLQNWTIESLRGL